MRKLNKREIKKHESAYSASTGKNQDEKVSEEHVHGSEAKGTWDLMPKAQSIQEKTDKLNLIKIFKTFAL